MLLLVILGFNRRIVPVKMKCTYSKCVYDIFIEMKKYTLQKNLIRSTIRR